MSPSHWRRRGLVAVLLLPIAGLFLILSLLRRWIYRQGFLKVIRLPVPVIVVGNITAGGSGKTPLVIALAKQFQAMGRRPGVISRGYGSEASHPRPVSVGGEPAATGDEPLLIARRTGCPVWVGVDRAAVGRALLSAHPECDLIIADDGLQHLRLGRDVEIAVIDRRGAMNGWPLPAGPLREPLARLAEVDAVVGHDWGGTPFTMALRPGLAYRLDKPGELRPLPDLPGEGMHAVAGIGEPQRFFDMLTGSGLRFQAHSFPDHHAYEPRDLQFQGSAIVTTEKDAIKFHTYATLPVWVVPVDADINPDLARFVLEKLHGPAPA